MEKEFKYICQFKDKQRNGPKAQAKGSITNLFRPPETSYERFSGNLRPLASETSHTFWMSGLIMDVKLAFLVNSFDCLWLNVL